MQKSDVIKGSLKGKLKIIYFELNKNESITYTDFGDEAKGVLKGKCITLNGYILKVENSHITNLSFYFKKLWEEQQIEHKTNILKMIYIKRNQQN